MLFIKTKTVYLKRTIVFTDFFITHLYFIHYEILIFLNVKWNYSMEDTKKVSGEFCIHFITNKFILIDGVNK